MIRSGSRLELESSMLGCRHGALRLLPGGLTGGIKLRMNIADSIFETYPVATSQYWQSEELTDTGDFFKTIRSPVVPIHLTEGINR
ncbi:hypothetical protein RRG08_042098 [Elysia crispata]|uniref:Uncharacterized protein n=1 Tax=Elysia crispata TaxID=231223 RepID=A0AAE1AIU9_9GAST|nr:hypothetical protein RRG08_042098 [Elysia crispata]